MDIFKERGVVLPTMMTHDRFLIKLPHIDDFDHTTINALRRCDTGLDVVGIVVTSEQKSTWPNLPNFHNELLENALKSIPVHFLAVELDDQGVLRPRSKGNGHFDENIYYTAIKTLSNYELVLEIDQNNFGTTITTEQFTMVDKKTALPVPKETVTALFPKYNIAGTEIGINATFKHLPIIHVDHMRKRKRNLSVRMSMGFAVVKSNGRSVVVTNHGYLFIPDKNKMDNHIKEEYTKKMDKLSNDIEKLSQLKRDRLDFQISGWQLDPKKFHQTKKEYVLFLRMIPLFSHFYLMDLLIFQLKKEMVHVVKVSLNSIEINLETKLDVDKDEEESQSFTCIMPVFSHTVASCLAEYLCNTFFNKTKNNVTMIFVSDVENYHTDGFKDIKVMYKVDNSVKKTEKDIQIVFEKHITQSIGLDSSGLEIKMAKNEKSMWTPLKVLREWVIGKY